MDAPSVLLDLRMVNGPLHGIARYALELARRLPLLEPAWRFEALVGKSGLPAGLGALAPRIPLRECAAGFLSLFEQPALTASLLEHRPDLFHATSFSVPALWPGRLVATLHDANHLALRDQYPPTHVAYYRGIVEPRVRRAAAIITVSEFSRRELSRFLHLAPERLQVIPNGVDAAFTPRPADEQLAIRKRLGLPEAFFLVTGNRKPFKNLRLAAELSRALPVPVVTLAGEGVVARFGFHPSAIELADLRDEDLPALYSAATALLLPSLYEGFGLPAIEAMACGTPVVCSNRGSLPEIAGAAAILLSPDDAEAWAETALRLHRDERARRELSERGLTRAARFNWDDCAKATLEVYRRALRLR